MTNEADYLSRQQKRFYREQAAKLESLREKLEEARSVASQIQTAPIYRIELEKLIGHIRQTLSQPIFDVSLRDMPWVDRLWIYIRRDRFLEIAVLASLAGAVASIVGAGLRSDELFQALLHLLQFFVPQAHAQGLGAVSLDSKSGIRYLILLVISAGFFFALGILAFSNKPDSRKFAADMIKTILGVYVGMATKLVD